MIDLETLCSLVIHYSMLFNILNFYISSWERLNEKSFEIIDFYTK